MNKPVYRTMDPAIVKPLIAFHTADIELKKIKLARALLSNLMRQKVRMEAPTFRGNQYPVPAEVLPSGVHGRIKMSYLSTAWNYDLLRELDPVLYEDSIRSEDRGTVRYAVAVDSIPSDMQEDLFPFVQPWAEGCGITAEWSDLLRWHQSLMRLIATAKEVRAACRNTMDLAVWNRTKHADMHDTIGELILHRPGFRISRRRIFDRRLPTAAKAKLRIDRPELVWRIERGIVEHPIEWSWPPVYEQTSRVYTNIGPNDPLSPNLIIGS